MSSPAPLVLASTSLYRRELLSRLRIPFTCANPATDEAALAGESASETALRLALLKARAVARESPGALVIGSDQVASLDGVRLGKPGTRANALRQLELASGRSMQFDTAVALVDAASGRERARVVPCRVTFRKLSARTIEAYLSREQPYDCAGSAKAEGLGIALIERIETDDPTSLVGLPLIALTGLLIEAGVVIP